MLYGKISLFLFLIFTPVCTFGADHCTNPDEYTVDKRCYVTAEQKIETPFNATVALMDRSGWIYCSGVIVKWGNTEYNPFLPKQLQNSDDNFYFITAKHCANNNNPDGKMDNTLRIKLQNGNVFTVTLIDYGNYNELTKNNLYGDWAVYRFPSIVDKDKIDYVYADIIGKYDGRSVTSVGYGGLKIMSDQEIEDFRLNYIKHIVQRENPADIINNPNKYGINPEGWLSFNNEKVHSFITIYTDFDTENALFHNKDLKMSKCTFSEYNNCQAWKGDSGGPMFDDKNHLVGVHTHALSGKSIGGLYHARGNGGVTTGQIYDQYTSETNMYPWEKALENKVTNTGKF